MNEKKIELLINIMLFCYVEKTHYKKTYIGYKPYFMLDITTKKVVYFSQNHIFDALQNFDDLSGIEQKEAVQEIGVESLLMKFNDQI